MRLCGFKSHLPHEEKRLRQKLGSFLFMRKHSLSPGSKVCAALRSAQNGRPLDVLRPIFRRREELRQKPGSFLFMRKHLLSPGSKVCATLRSSLFFICYVGLFRMCYLSGGRKCMKKQDFWTFLHIFPPDEKKLFIFPAILVFFGHFLLRKENTP